MTLRERLRRGRASIQRRRFARCFVPSSSVLTGDNLEAYLAPGATPNDSPTCFPTLLLPLQERRVPPRRKTIQAPQRVDSISARPQLSELPSFVPHATSEEVAT